MFFHLGKIVTRFRWLIVGLWMVAIAIALPFAPQATQVLHSGDFVSPDFESEQALTRVRNWSAVSGVISFTDNPRQISFDRHAA
jgi:putative drug exporter of the RND superfamily